MCLCCISTLTQLWFLPKSSLSTPLNKHLEYFSSKKIFSNLLLCPLTRSDLCAKFAKQNPFEEASASRGKSVGPRRGCRRWPRRTGGELGLRLRWWIVALLDLGSIFRWVLGRCFPGKGRLPPRTRSPSCLYTRCFSESGASHSLGFFERRLWSHEWRLMMMFLAATGKTNIAQLGLSVSGSFERFGKQETRERSDTQITRIRDGYWVFAGSVWGVFDFFRFCVMNL